MAKVILEEGGEPLSVVLIVFVCTGNTCRSPLAEALCKRLLADRLGCGVEELPRRGYLVTSAGVAVMTYQPAAVEAVEVANASGADLQGHVSQPLTPEVAQHADHLLTMTHGHLETVLALYPQLSCQPRLLSPAGEDICDPIGGDREVYEACARQVRSSLEAFIAEVVREPT